ncbi:General transcription factor II-I repeat domain-containing protein 2B [Acipenser ruthenus]|uniref:General transcription factor II-I repeat domain-containing protein 2B n=1 Tax=Acipenser ruthenus TaxID=7906 RepID=A0A662YSM2_ACIRT|nr:General transcription factor II-I repeat domain-containing protein 2B [Acipenser ruthenus]
MEPKMSASWSKRHKVDSENRAFNPNWTADFLFIMPSYLNAKPLCLICQTTVAVNLKRHFESKHSNFNTAYPPGSVLRRDKIESLKSSYHTSNLILTTSATVQEKATAASLRAGELLEFMNDVPTMSRVAFLCDITGHLNTLNLQLQGRASSVGDLFEKVCVFQRNFEIFNTDLTGKMLHFPTLRVVATDETSMKMMQEFMNNLIKNFQMRFENFKIPKDVLLFVRDPFVVSADGPCPSEAKNILHSIDEGLIQSSDVLKAKFRELGPCDFWTQYADQFQNSQNLAVFLLTMFGSTFLCESGFSSMNIIKNQHCSHLTDEHLHQCMRLALTSYKPVFTKLARERRCHLSH